MPARVRGGGETEFPTASWQSLGGVAVVDGSGPAARGWQGTREREDDALRGARGARTTCEPREGPWFDARMCFRGSAAWLRLEGAGSRGRQRRSGRGLATLQGGRVRANLRVYGSLLESRRGRGAWKSDRLSLRVLAAGLRRGRQGSVA